MIPFHIQILNSCQQFGDDIALTDSESGRDLSFSQVFSLSYRLAHVFKRLGVIKSEILLTNLPNCLEYPIIFLASSLNGAVLSGVSSELTQYELSQYIDHTETRFIISNHELAKNIPTSDKYVVITTNVLNDEEISNDSSLFNPSIYTLSPFSSDDIILAPFSSGTTGHPKCVLLSHENYITATESLKCGLFNKLGEERRSSIAFLPFYHASGFWALLFMLYQGHRSIIMSHFNIGRMIELVEKHEISILNVVPSIISALLRNPAKMTSLRTLLCGSAPLGKELSEAIMSKYPHIDHLIQGYGMTEVVVLSHATPPREKQRYGSCGRLLPGFEAKIVDENGEEVAKLESGQLYLRSRSIMKSYLRDGSPLDNEGWLPTGDIAYVDGDGFYYIVDRLKDVFKVHGKQVSPSEIEDVLISHEYVSEAAVIGIPDEHSGCIPRAYIVLFNQYNHSHIPQISSYVKEKLSPHKQLKGGISVVDDLPRSNSGKVLRRVLLDQYNESQ